MHARAWIAPLNERPLIRIMLVRALRAVMQGYIPPSTEALSCTVTISSILVQ